jgi:DNA topoisomerase-1
MERKGIGRPSTYAPTIKTLKERDYVQVAKGKLQPTALGMELDAALEKLLPDLIQPEFTAQMESTLDAIAQGQQDWQMYLTTWHRTYFAPALEKANQLLGAESSHPKDRAKPKDRAAVTQIACPQCGQAMSKIPSKSKKLKADHFLKCAASECGTVMFWNPSVKRYELPYAQRTPDPEAFTEIPCPVCGALLERYSYTKEGKAKLMLRCSIAENRRVKCKEVAFFEGRDGFWSPKFGNL